MSREEATEFIAQSVKSNVDMAKVADAIEALEQEPCEGEYIKVPKKALKYRTAEIVAYNVEWLKKHFDMERAIIFGELAESKVESEDKECR